MSTQVFVRELCFYRAGVKGDANRLFMCSGQFNCGGMDDLIDRCLGRTVADPTTYPIIPD